MQDEPSTQRSARRTQITTRFVKQPRKITTFILFFSNVLFCLALCKQRAYSLRIGRRRGVGMLYSRKQCFFVVLSRLYCINSQTIVVLSPLRHALVKARGQSMDTAPSHSRKSQWIGCNRECFVKTRSNVWIHLYLLLPLLFVVETALRKNRKCAWRSSKMSDVLHCMHGENQ
jgi:hypothetical protein